MIRLSPSLLESYRLFLTEDWFTVERMRESIQRKFEPTPAMALGTAYHAMLENYGDTHTMYLTNGAPTEHEMIVTQDGFRFAYEPCIEPVRDFLLAQCVHEVYGTRTLKTSYGEVSIAAKADAVWGNIGGEWKTTTEAIQIQKYMDSAQWKLCSWVLGLRALDYRIMRLEAREDGVWTIIASEAIQCVWSDSLMTEIMDLIAGLIEFHKQQGLEEYLIPYYERKRTAA